MAKKVFISYAWEGEELAEKILGFSNALRANGVDAIIDQYEENPDMGWPIWMEKQIELSDFVLVVSTKTYLDKFNQMCEGKGVTWEVSSIYQSLYNLKGHNNKFIPVVFDDADKQYILKALQPYTSYNIKNQFNKLVNRIKGIANVEKPPVTEESLPLKERKTLFVSPINIGLWDKANWMGVIFLFASEKDFALGFLYKGDESSAVKIFEEWQGYKNIDDYIDVCFIEGNIEELPPNGYTCLIAPNVSKVIEHRNHKTKTDIELIMLISRFQRMYPKDNFRSYNLFKHLVSKNKGRPIPIFPVTVINQNKPDTNDNFQIHYSKAVYLKNIRFKNSSDIIESDIESCVMPKYNSNFPNSHKKL